MMASASKFKVFLCHASQDKPVVRDLYRRLRHEEWIDPWLDEEALLPKKAAPYSAIVLAVFLFFIGSKLILNLFDIWPDTMYPIIMISAVIAAVLILLDL